MRRTLFVAIAMTATSSFAPVLASPAQDLFNQATFYVGFYYAGAAQVLNYRDLRKQYQPKLDLACGIDAKCPYTKAYPVVQEMIAAVGDPFTRIIDSSFERLASGAGAGNPRFGIVTRSTAAGLVIVRVLSTEAAEGTLERGDVIKAVNGKAATLEAITSAELSAKATSFDITRKGLNQVVNLTAKIATEGQKPFEVDDAPKNVMVIRINDFYWEGEVARKIHQLVRKANNNAYKGIVLDLRDTDWGFDSESIFVARAFTDQLNFQYKNRFQAGTRSFKLMGNAIAVERQGASTPVTQFEGTFQNWKNPVSVIVNKYTTHNAEMLAYFLQRIKRAQVVGEPSAGTLGVAGGLSSLDVSIGDTSLIDGTYLNVSNDRLLNTDGTAWPLKIVPDINQPENLNAIAAGTDAALETAIEILEVK